MFSPDDRPVEGTSLVVPSAFYKVVLRPADAGWEAIAFLAENRAYPAPHDLSQVVVSIDELEALTRIDFFPDLSAAAQSELESATPQLW